MTPDDTLKAFLKAGTPGPRDYVFELAVAGRIARRRFWMRQLALLPWLVVAVLLGASSLPVLGAIGSGLAPLMQQVGMIGGIAGVTLVAAGLLVRRFGPV